MLYFAEQNFGADYIKIIFSNKDSVASSILMPDTTFQIQFKDARLRTFSQSILFWLKPIKANDHSQTQP